VAARPGGWRVEQKWGAPPGAPPPRRRPVPWSCSRG
jgi:hypothetical protein